MYVGVGGHEILGLNSCLQTCTASPLAHRAILLTHCLVILKNQAQFCIVVVNHFLPGCEGTLRSGDFTVAWRACGTVKTSRL